ncbi:hypothetical protein LWI29_034591 [Acer saccharum]|uniref:Uncharacterized protein n=1 Tax=Acer saccharum TaxID=4024 RepID=A0AA39W518_ACESA|nr:hypothetical protein LWI29_034591 [Acer saccharum]
MFLVFSAHDRHWDNEANYTFVRAEIVKLEQDGNLAHKISTIVDETNSTRAAGAFLDARFLELSNAEMILDKYPDIEVELGQYYMVDDQFDLHSFRLDLAQFSFYSPFTNKIIELPALDMTISAGKIFTDAMATFSTAPTSSDCVIWVVSTEPPKKEVSFRPLFFEEFCVSTCSPGCKTWNNVLLGTNGNRYCAGISGIAQVDGVLYFIFHKARSMIAVMGAFKLGLQE